MEKIAVRNNRVIVGLALLTGLTVSCKKLIEIPANPPTSITQSEQFADSVTAMTAVVSVYTYYTGMSTGFGYDDGLLAESTGLSSDELIYTGSTDQNLPAFYSYGLSPLNTDISNLWNAPYTSLYTVNAVLEGVDGSSGLSASFKRQIEGEMKVIRALYYFNMVNLFGGLPLVTTTAYATTSRLARASEDSVYDQIIADLTDAQQALTSDYPSPGHLRPNLYTAQALLAKVYLVRGQWQEAYDAANAVISSGVYSLEPDGNSVFLDGSQEAIWQLPASGGFDVATAEAQGFVPSSGGTYPEFILTPYLVNAFESGDQRLADWVGQVIVGNDTAYYPYKYKNRLIPSSTTEDYMILRLGEQYLVRAEAEANLGNGANALADIDVVRTRAGLPASTANPGNKTEVLNAIMHERQVELFTEWGNRWYDLKRTNTAAAVLGVEKPGWTANAVLYPIPQTQIQADNLLLQNPGY